MKVVCKNCRTSYTVKDENVPLTGTKVKCPKCHHTIVIENPAHKKHPEPEFDHSKTMVLFMPMPKQLNEQFVEVASSLAGESVRMPAALRLSLVVLEGDEVGKECALTKQCTIIGRGQADILLADPEVSRKHAAIEFYGDKAVIRDMKSTNGTYVNQLGVKLSYLKDGDVIQAGNTRFTVRSR